MERDLDVASILGQSRTGFCEKCRIEVAIRDGPVAGLK